MTFIVDSSNSSMVQVSGETLRIQGKLRTTREFGGIVRRIVGLGVRPGYDGRSTKPCGAVTLTGGMDDLRLIGGTHSRETT